MVRNDIKLCKSRDHSMIQALYNFTHCRIFQKVKMVTPLHPHIMSSNCACNMYIAAK